MLGGGPYEATTCPECGSTMWNGRCENPDCKYHWYPERGGRMIYTVFPKDEGEMPQDFQTYSDAKEYGDGEFGKGNYTIESTEGECV